MKPRIIVAGLGDTGYRIFSLLRQQGAAVVGISERPKDTLYGERFTAYIEEESYLKENNEDIVIGDLRSSSVLMQAGIKDAHTLVLASDDDALNLAVLTQARLLNPRIRIINRLYNQTLGERLDRTLPDHFSMSVCALAAPIFAFAAQGNKAIGQLRLFNKTWPIHEEVIDENHPWLGLKLSQLWDNPSRMLIHYLPVQGEMNLVTAVVQNHTLQRGDHLIVGTKPVFRGKRSRLSQKLLKPFINLRQYQRHARPVALVTFTLLMIICLASFTYVLANFHTSLVDAFYFSVGMITGAGGKEEVAEKGPDSLKIFTAIMMIVGAGVIGICYALINDFVLGSRFKEFLDAARVPTRNHYIVCGLGGIGMEIVRQLHAQGYEVVVIESDHNNRFLHSARSLGVPIILADASLDDSLKAANIQNADVLLAVTSNDMVNVEISLTAKAIAPKLSLIVRCQDSQFARSVEEVFGFETVLSPIELATHSFAAAALGGKILGNGMTDDLLWVALATMITSAHPFCGQSIKNAAMTANFVPLYLERKTCTIHSWKLLDVVLQSGDILYLTMPANRLEQLWRAKRIKTPV